MVALARPRTMPATLDPFDFRTPLAFDSPPPENGEIASRPQNLRSTPTHPTWPCTVPP